MIEQQAAVRLRRVGEAGLASAILFGLVIVLNLAFAWSLWNAYGLVQDFLADDPGVGMADLLDADRLTRTLGWAVLAVQLAAAVVFLVWLWRARRNSEVLTDAPHRRGRGWAIGSWITPVVFFWFPFQVVDDVYRASRPDNPKDLYDLQTVPGSTLLRWWWGMYLAGWVLDRLAAASLTGYHVEDLQAAAVAQSAQVVALTGAGIALVIVMRQITRWQQTPRVAPDAPPEFGTEAASSP
ncbi:DUF4328 domain-containing protein [Actinophytocola sp.]|uniref:DUF4328 domain-containing protein n=1 Tax=Actinophytocola sp. TaxID=1872138 RepID=UPI002D7FA5F0|nr:DUF4328 domain-containing protein [Actinophytocola sp.]HET9142141.1 DUF4328 domain-containing protein [Actinophytocola sp.]